MSIFNFAKYMALVTAFCFLFINWKIAIALLIAGSLIHTIPMGPPMFFKVLSGYFVISGIVVLFFDWRIGIGLLILGYIAAPSLKTKQHSN